ncbi:MAG TPA: hypothetical protein VLV83_23290 [Acidobacteriota bacterium]|nr:hypothetical protein [Acidobacteriota bacterium]
MRRLFLTLLLLLCAVALLRFGTLEATTAVRLSEQDMALQSDLIAVGVCQDVRTAWVGRELYTFATIEVNETLKGVRSRMVTVVVPGGIDAAHNPPIARIYPGAVTPAQGARVFLFLNEIPAMRPLRMANQENGALRLRSLAAARQFAIAGFSQGIFSVVGEPGRERVARNLSGLKLLSPTGVQEGGAESMPLQDFRDRIQSYLNER